MRFLLTLFAGLSFLAACTSPASQSSVPAGATPASLAANGDALIISRGYATTPNKFRADDVGAVGKMIFTGAEAKPRFDIMNPVGIAQVDRSAHRISVVPAGTYYLTQVQNGKGTISYGPERFLFPPVTVKPGDVLYLGDIHLRNIGGKARATITNQAAQARARLAATSPSLAQRMQTRLLACLFCTTY